MCLKNFFMILNCLPVSSPAPRQQASGWTCRCAVRRGGRGGSRAPPTWLRSWGRARWRGGRRRCAPGWWWRRRRPAARWSRTCKWCERQCEIAFNVSRKHVTVKSCQWYWVGIYYAAQEIKQWSKWAALASAAHSDQFPISCEASYLPVIHAVSFIRNTVKFNTVMFLR